MDENGPWELLYEPRPLLLLFVSLKLPQLTISQWLNALLRMFIDT